MESKRFNAQNQNSPFFALISDAEQIDVQEIPETHPEGTSERSFLVKIKPKISSPSGKTPQSLFDNARLLMANGDYLLARNLFSFLLRQNLRDELAMEGLGVCFLKLKETTAAKKCFKALWELHQKNRYAIYLGLCYLADQKEEEALSVFQQVDREKMIDNDVAFEFYKGLGNLLFKKQQWTEAEELYQRALAQNPNSEAILANLGTLEIQRKNLNKAQEYFQRSLECDPKNSKAQAGMGLVKLEGGDRKGALSCFNIALDCEAKNTLALKIILSMSDQEVTIEEKKQRLLHFLQGEPQNGEMRYQLAKLLLQENRFFEANKEIEKAERSLPNDERIQKLKKILTQNRHWGSS